MADGQFQEGLPPVAMQDFPSEKPGLDVLFITCPHCGQRTDSLKLYDAAIVGWKDKWVLSCSQCMRRSLLRRTLFVLPLTTFLAPLYGWFLWRDYQESRKKGHSPAAMVEMQRLSAEKPFDQSLQEINLRKTPRRELVLVGILLFIIACFWAIPFAFRSPPTVDGKTVTEWAEQLKSPDPETRLRALIKLQDFGPNGREARPALFEIAQHDPEPHIRWAAMEVLQIIGF